MAEKTSVPEPNSEINKLVYVIRDDGSYGGWRTELLVEEMTEKGEGKFLLCNYCRGVLRDACLFEKDDEQEFRCSVCIPTDVNKQKVQMNREAVNKKQANCPLKGCDWTNELSELLHHLEECELFPVACPLGCRDERGEVSRVERRGVETHRTCCPMRTVKCEYCSVSMKACDMDEHQEECEEFPIPCPNKCSEEIRVKRKDKSIHLSQECPLQETECPYSQYGCEAKVQRRNLEQHEKEDMHKHMKLTINNMQSEVITLQKENEELRTKIVNLEKNNEEFRSSLQEEKEDMHKHLKLTGEEIDHLKISQSLLIPKISNLGAKGNLEWKISGVKNKISQKEDTFSEPFYVGLYKFQGIVGWVCNDIYVALFLCIMKGEWDDTLKWPIRYEMSMVLINQLDAKDNYEKNGEVTKEYLKRFPHCFNKPRTEKNKGFGYPEFISHADLLQEKYSKDASIMLKISVELILDAY